MSNDIHAAVLTISDSVSRGIREDASGPEACRLLAEAGLVVTGPEVIPDARPFIALRLRALAAEHRLIVTTGGTGLGPRDVTPEATRDVIEREAPGLAELIRTHGAAQTPLAALSRGVAGMLGDCLVINLPGSPAAVRDGLAALAPVLRHALEIASGRTEHGQ